MKLKRNQVFLLLGVLVVVIALFGSNLGLFSTQTYGECVFTTNVNPIDGGYRDYKGSDKWITADLNGDGIHEKFGWAQERVLTSQTSRCGKGLDADDGDYKLLVNDFQSTPSCNQGTEGDDIYYDSVRLDRLYVCSCSAFFYQEFRLDYGAAENAEITCSSEGTFHEADTNKDGQVDRNELGVVITSWINGQITRNKLGEAIVAWL